MPNAFTINAITLTVILFITRRGCFIKKEGQVKINLKKKTSIIKIYYQDFPAGVTNTLNDSKTLENI